MPRVSDSISGEVARTAGLNLAQAPPLAQEGPAACYICQLAATPGRFLPEKAAQLGVPKGPLFGQLKAGNAVELPGGRIIQPHEVG